MFDVIKKRILTRLEKYNYNAVFVEAGKDCATLSIKDAADYIVDNGLDFPFTKRYAEQKLKNVKVDDPELIFIEACDDYRKSSFKFQLAKIVLRAWNLVTIDDVERGVIFTGLKKGGELEFLDELMDELEM